VSLSGKERKFRWGSLTQYHSHNPSHEKLRHQHLKSDLLGWSDDQVGSNCIVRVMSRMLGLTGGTTRDSCRKQEYKAVLYWSTHVFQTLLCVLYSSWSLFASEVHLGALSHVIVQVIPEMHIVRKEMFQRPVGVVML
jgi:hypothetical protein